MLLNSYLDKYLSDMIDLSELSLDQSASWLLNVDVHLPGEMSLSQLQHISICINAAFRDLRFPQVVVTQDPATNSTVVDLLENVAEDTHADKLEKIGTKSCPLVLLVGISDSIAKSNDGKLVNF